MYKYGMKSRGYSIGCQPSGVKKFEDVDKWKTGYWSFIYYDEPLDDNLLDKYDLEFIEEV